MAFPLDGTGGTAAPSYYATNPSLVGRNNTFYVGDTVTLNLSQATPTTYDVYDYFGNHVGTGAVSGTSVNLGSSWSPGWYRVRYTGSSTDPVYGASYGASCFIVLRNDSRFQTLVQGTPLKGNGAPGQHTSPPDYVMRGGLGIASPRMVMGAAVNADSSGNDSVGVLALDAPFATQYWSDQAYPYYDPDRTRYNWTSFPNRSWDKLDLSNASAQVCLTVYPRVAFGSNASNLYVTVASGTSSGFKITVSYPNNTTVVETWDNLTTTDAAATAINAGSSYIWLQVIRTGDTPANITATAVGTGYWDGLAYASSTLYPLGVGFYEGPINEPGLLDSGLPQKCALFAAAIRAGNPNAKILGPSPVNITDNWKTFFQTGAQSNFDYIAFHDYNTFLGFGTISMSRGQIESFLALRDQYAPGKPLWQTEATSAYVLQGGGTSSIGLMQPRISGGTMLNLILWEQYGLPRERNSYWYDYGAGFWSVPAFQWMGDSTPQPITILQRVLAEETFGKPFAYRLDMGCEALEKILVGSVYQAHTSTSAPSVAVFIAGSHIPGAKLTLNVTGTTNALTVVDAFGNSSTVTPSSGKVQIPVDDVPTYLELPAGVTISVSSFFDGAQDWGSTPNPSVSRAATTMTLGGVSAPAIADDQWMTAYTGTTNSPGITYSSITVPDTAVLLFPSTISVDRVVIFNGPPFQSTSALTTFTVDTTADGGSTWTTQETVDISAQSVSTQFGTTQKNAGCGYETFATMQHIFPVSFASPVSCNGVRISVSATTFGGSPDSQSYHTSSASANEQRVNLQEIMVISGSAPTNSVSAPANTALPSFTGTARLGTVVSCAKGSWLNIPTKYTFQWKRDGSNITGATSAHYLVATADLGHSLTCAVTASNLGGSATATSGGLNVPTLRMVA